MKPRKISLNLGTSVLGIAALAFAAGAIGVQPAYAEPSQATQSVDAATLTGTVVDFEGEPLIGASVLVKGTTTGAVTDLDGKFSIKAKPGQEIRVTYIGYKAFSTVVKKGQTDLGRIVMDADSQSLDDVVVIGYGTQKKGDVTSAVASVKAEDFTMGAIGDASELVKGKVAGLTIAKGSGDPNA